MRRGRILILLGLILALGTAAAVFILLQSTTAPTETVNVEREEVVVAVQPIAEDESVAGRLELRAVPVESIPQGALRSLDGTSGMLAAGPIPQGTVIQPELLITPQQRMAEAQLGNLVEPGFVAVALPINELSSVSYGVQASDHVDVLMTFYFLDIDPDLQMDEPICPPLCPAAEGQTGATLTEQHARLTAQLTLQDLTVLGVGRWNFAPQPTEEELERAEAEGEEPITSQPPQYITLMLTPQDALVLKLAREQGASIDLAVRAADDAQQFTTQQVTLDYIMARFGVSVPPKQPYRIQNVNAPNAGTE